MGKTLIGDLFPKQYFSIVKHKAVECQDHLHYMMEFVFVTEGTLEVGWEGKTNDLKCGEGMLFMPYEIHSYSSKQYNQAVVIVFSPEFVEELQIGAVFEKHSVNISENALDYAEKNMLKSDKSMVDIKAILYPLISDFFKDNRVLSVDEMHNEIFLSALKNIYNHYNEDISLKSVAKNIGCHYVYLSRNFSKATGLSFISYLNRFRVAKSLEMLKNTNLSITEIAYETGFCNLRSYNRAFKQYMTVTPTEYRKNDDKVHTG